MDSKRNPKTKIIKRVKYMWSISTLTFCSKPSSYHPKTNIQILHYALLL